MASEANTSCFCQNPQWQKTRDSLVQRLREVRDFVYTLRERRAIPMKTEMDSVVKFFESGKFGAVEEAAASGHKPVTREDMLRESEIAWWATKDPAVKAKLQEQIAGLRGISLKSKEVPDAPPPEVDRELAREILAYVFEQKQLEGVQCSPGVQ